MKAAKVLGQPDTPIDPMFEGRKTTLKPHKDGRLVVEIERAKGDADKPEPEGWLAKKTKWVRVFETAIHDKQDDEIGADANTTTCSVPSRRPPSSFSAGWSTTRAANGSDNPAANVKMLLQNLGNAKDKAECIMGGAIGQSWELVSLPFREEYPGGRQWNRDAAQFSYQPAALEPDETPHHPHWDMIFDHIGVELTPALRSLPWAQKANIKTGADYLRAWVACAFRDPFEPTPYLFLWGNENSRQKHPPRGAGTAGDQGRRQGRQGPHQQQRVQRRTGRGHHLRRGGEGHHPDAGRTRPHQGVCHRPHALHPPDAAGRLPGPQHHALDSDRQQPVGLSRDSPATRASR